MGEIHYEMLWDCDACGTRGLLGVSHRHCPACGAAQNPERRYFPAPGEEVEAKNHVFSGVDWRCAYCDSPNAAAAKFCVNCSAGQDGAKPVALKFDGQGAALPGSPASPPPTPVPASQFVSNAASPGRGGKGWLILLLLAVFAVAGIGSLIAMFLTTTETAVTVGTKTWERSIAIERFSPASDAAWCDSLPAGAYDISRSREVRSQRKIEDGQNCTEKRVDKGDGSFVKQQECTPRYRDEPVYDERCRYRINRWLVDRQIVATQDSAPQPEWPSVRLASALRAETLGAEREGGRSEHYRVVLQAGGEQWTCDLPESRWRSLAPGKGATVAVRALGGADCDSLR